MNPPEQIGLFDNPPPKKRKVTVRARTSDPETSHYAARKLEEKEECNQTSIATVLAILTDHPNINDFQLRSYWIEYHPEHIITCENLPRNARDWARKQGKVRKTGRNKNISTGRPCDTWSVGTPEPDLRERCPHCGRVMRKKKDKNKNADPPGKL